MVATELSLALRKVADVLRAGERTHPTSSPHHWTKLSDREHVRRGLAHSEKYLLGVCDGDTDELACATTRLLLALERRERTRVENSALSHSLENPSDKEPA